MAINPNLVSIIPASELPTGVPTPAGQFFFYEGNEMKKSPMTEIYELVSGSQSIGTITPSSTIPTDGNIWGFAGEGTYPNAGNITVAAGKFAILSRVGTTWSKVEVATQQEEDFFSLKDYSPTVDLTQNNFSNLQTLTGNVTFTRQPGGRFGKMAVYKLTGGSVSFGVGFVQQGGSRLYNPNLYNIITFWQEYDKVKYFIEYSTSSGSGSDGTIPTDFILAYDFDGDLQDKSPNGNHGVNSGNTSGVLSYVAGSKIGKKALYVEDNYVKTAVPLNVASNKVSVSLWVKTTQSTAPALLAQHGETATINSFYSYTNEGGFSINGVDKGLNKRSSNFNIFDGNWHHIVFVFDRSLGTNQTLIYVDGFENSSATSANADIADSDFGAATLYLLMRDDTTIGFKGAMERVKVYDRVLSNTEVTQLYYE